MTTSVLRTIDKKGGLDRYLLETSEKNLFGKLAVQMRRNLEAKIEKIEPELGLPGVGMDGEAERVAKDEKEAEQVLINPVESNELVLIKKEVEKYEGEAMDLGMRKRVKSKKRVNKKKGVKASRRVSVNNTIGTLVTPHFSTSHST